LPDISFIGTLLGHASDDRRDADRDKLTLDSFELAFQGNIYPGMRAEAFVVNDSEGTNVEEAYVNVENLGIKGLPLSGTFGRRKVPFGRVNQLHSHSWLYVVQPYALSNLVAPESLVGDGATVSYLAPTKQFVQLDLGLWGNASHDPIPTPDPTVPTPSTGAGFSDRMQTARLWSAQEAFKGTLEYGASYAHGGGQTYASPAGPNVTPKIDLTGLDLTFRREGRNATRTLLRGEVIQHKQKDGAFSRTSTGYYLFADQKVSANREYGIRYDWSEFPYSPGHVGAVSLIGTQRLTEQTYFRLQAIHGDRPGKQGFNALWFEWVWGYGPHTHNLE
jgi:hypothetical protein